MNVLFLLDNCKMECGANINIALNIAKVLKGHGHCLYLVCQDNRDKNDNSRISIFDHVALVNVEQNSSVENWDEYSYAEKILYFLTHPKVFWKWLDSRLYKHRMFEKLKLYNKEYQFDCILAVTAPFYIAEIIAKLKTKSKRIIIELDPYTTNETKALKDKSRRKRIESRTYKRIDYILAARSHYGELLEEFPRDRGKIVAFDIPSISSSILHKSKRDSCKRTFTFAGMLYRDIRNPKYMLDLFSVLPEDYYLNIAGVGEEDTISDYKELLGSRLRYYGSLSIESANDLVAQSCFLVNLNNSITNQLPSKLFEYLGTGYPMVNICKTKKCPSLIYTKKSRNCVDIFEDDPLEVSAQKIISFAELYQNTVVSQEIIMETFKENTVEYATEMIEKMINGK